MHYDIDIFKIPYLLFFVNFQANIQPQLTELVYNPIPLFDIVLKGIKSGYCQCFCSLSANLSQHCILCDMYDFLHIDVFGGQFINKIFCNLKSDQSDYDCKERWEIKSDKSKACNTVFKLLCLIFLKGFKDEMQDNTKVFNAVLYVISHAATFKWRTRSVVQAAYEEWFIILIKQTAGLNKWEKKDTAKLAVKDTDNVIIKKEKSDCYYTFDYSD